jgi:rubrerythrin
MRRVLHLLLLSALAAGSVIAQDRPERMSDKDVSKLLENIHDDSKKFKNSFNSALGKSTIRRTSREKDAKKLADQFVKQTDVMSRNFKGKRKIDNNIVSVFASARDIDRVVQEASISGAATSDWSKVRSELDELAREFNYTPPS